jgi:hypothetical protein
LVLRFFTRPLSNQEEPGNNLDSAQTPVVGNNFHYAVAAQQHAADVVEEPGLWGFRENAVAFLVCCAIIQTGHSAQILPVRERGHESGAR